MVDTFTGIEETWLRTSHHKFSKVLTRFTVQESDLIDTYQPEVRTVCVAPCEQTCSVHPKLVSFEPHVNGLIVSGSTMCKELRVMVLLSEWQSARVLPEVP